MNRGHDIIIYLILFEVNNSNISLNYEYLTMFQQNTVISPLLNQREEVERYGGIDGFYLNGYRLNNRLGANYFGTLVEREAAHCSNYGKYSFSQFKNKPYLLIAFSLL